ncbi:MAG: FHA domain-containing protein [Planctomycetota bacterium]|nr:FHA domain-containing protein [Planctomycetota bacterium]
MAKLVFRSGPYNGKSVGIPAGKTITFGRNRDVELPLPDLKLSRRHCQLSYDGQRYVLTDLGSTNGTYVNGARISGAVELNDFDRIVLGDVEIEFHSAEKVPLPLNFDAAAADPFGLDPDEDVVPLEELRGAEDEPAAAPPVAAADAAPAADSPPLEELPLASPPAPAAPMEAPVLVPLPPEEAPAPPPAVPVAAPQPVPAHADASGEGGIKPLPRAEADPLAAALCDISLPLPAEPPLAIGDDVAGDRPKILFCTVCEGSIPTLDYDLGAARVVDGRLCCKECLAKERKAAATAGAGPKPKEKTKGVSDILAALDSEPIMVDTTLRRGGHAAEGADAGKKEPEKVARAATPPAPLKPVSNDILAALDREPVVVDTTLKRGGQAVPEADVAKRVKDMERIAQAQTTVQTTPGPGTPAPAPPAKPAASKNIKEELGEEFEEIT